jgi:hypothetical protein
VFGRSQMSIGCSLAALQLRNERRVRHRTCAKVPPSYRFVEPGTRAAQGGMVVAQRTPPARAVLTRQQICPCPVSAATRREEKKNLLFES